MKIAVGPYLGHCSGELLLQSSDPGVGTHHEAARRSPLYTNSQWRALCACSGILSAANYSDSLQDGGVTNNDRCSTTGETPPPAASGA